MAKKLRKDQLVSVKAIWNSKVLFKAKVTSIEKQDQEIDSIPFDELDRDVIVYFDEIKKWAYGFQIIKNN